MSLRDSEAELCREINELMKDHPHNTGLDWIGSGEDQPKPVNDPQADVGYDQPKPATGEVCGFTGNTIPATGEWTADTVRRLEFDNSDRRYDAIANAHNAALAAAWRKGHADAQAPALERIEALHKQLAAERKTVKEYEDYIKELDAIALAKVK